MGTQRVQIMPDRSVVTPVDGVKFDAAAETYTSSIIQTQSYTKFLMVIQLDVTRATTTANPTDILISVEFGYSNTTTAFHKYMNGLFGDLRFEDAATSTAKECVKGDVLADYTRINVISSGCSATAYFSLTVKMILNS